MDVIRMNKHIANISPIRTGDVDGDNRVTSADADLLARFLLGTAPSSSVDTYAANVNGDKSVDSTDLLMINKYLLK